MALKKDGTVVAEGSKNSGQCNVGTRKDIVAISASGEHTVGLMSYGTVVAVDKNYDGQCDVSVWRDIRTGQ